MKPFNLPSWRSAHCKIVGNCWRGNRLCVGICLLASSFPCRSWSPGGSGITSTSTSPPPLENQWEIIHAFFVNLRTITFFSCSNICYWMMCPVLMNCVCYSQHQSNRMGPVRHHCHAAWHRWKHGESSTSLIQNMRLNFLSICACKLMLAPFFLQLLASTIKFSTSLCCVVAINCSTWVLSGLKWTLSISLRVLQQSNGSWIDIQIVAAVQIWNCAPYWHVASHPQVIILGSTNTITIKEFLKVSLGYEYSFIGPVVGILLGFTIFFGGLAIGECPPSHIPYSTQQSVPVPRVVEYRALHNCFAGSPCSPVMDVSESYRTMLLGAAAAQ